MAKRKGTRLKRVDRVYLSWESQVRQYPAAGDPGLSYFRGNLEDGAYVDCLLYRDAAGQLVGILNHYPQDFPPWEEKHGVNVWVRPDRQRQGIGTALMRAACERWPVVLEDQRYTPAGARLYRALRRGEV